MAAARILLIFVVGLALNGCDAEPREELTASPTGEASDPGTGSPAPDRAPPGAPNAAINERGTQDKTGMSRVELTLELDDNYFEPTYIEVDSGAQLNVELENEGGRTHTFTVEELDIDEVIEAGGKKEIDFRAEGSEVIPFYCRFHRDQGMSGEFRLS